MSGTRLINLSRRDFGRLSMLALGSALAGPSLATKHMTKINGYVAPGFERVKDAFTANFEKHGEVGAAFCLYHRCSLVSPYVRLPHWRWRRWRAPLK